MALCRKQQREQFTHVRIIFDDEDRATLPGNGSRMSSGVSIRRRHYRGFDAVCRQRNLDGEDRAFAELRAHIHLVAQKCNEPLHDREAKTKATAALAGFVVELVILLENRLQFSVRDADACVPDLDAERAATPPAAQQHFARPRVFDRIGQQIADHLLQQARIGVDDVLARHDPEL